MRSCLVKILFEALCAWVKITKFRSLLFSQIHEETCMAKSQEGKKESKGKPKLTIKEKQEKKKEKAKAKGK